jgi:hypothetical protein
MSVKDVLDAFHEKGLQIKIDILDEEEETPSILVDGSSHALEFLGNLFLEFSKEGKDCGFQISPSGAGSVFFSETSKFGLYIHRTPCKHSTK